MPLRQSSSFLTTAAICVSIVVGIGLAGYMMKPLPPSPSVDSVATATPPSVPPAPSPVPSPTSTPKPTTVAATPAPTKGTPEQTRLSGIVRDHLGKTVSDAEIFVVKKSGERLPLALAKALRENGGAVRKRTDAGGLVEIPLTPDSRWLTGILVEGEPVGIVQEVATVSGDAVNVEYIHPRPFELRGTVVNDLFERVPDVELEAVWTMQTLLESPAQKTRKIRSDEGGRFAFALPQAISATVRIVPEGLPAEFLPERNPIILSRRDLDGQTSLRADLALVRVAPLRASVVSSEDNHALGGVEVELRAADLPTTGGLVNRWVGTTDGEGVVSFAGLYPGEYTVSVRAQGFNPFALADFRPSDEPNPTFSLIPLSDIHGKVTPPEDVAIESWTISLLNRYQGFQQTTQAGSFEFSNVAPGEWLLAVEGKGANGTYYHEQMLSAPQGEDLEVGAIAPTRQESVSGRLIIPAGSTLPGVALEATPVTGSIVDFPVEAAYTQWRRLPVVTVTSGGSFQLENLIGGTQYRIIARNRESGALLGSAKATAGQAQPVGLALGGVGSIRGRVLNPRAEACIGVEVRVTVGLGTIRGETGDIQTWTTTAGYDGSYEFTNVPVGQVRLQVAGDDKGGKLLSIAEGRATVADLACRTWVAILFDLKPGDTTPFAPQEQFLIIPQPGTVVLNQVTEIYLENLKADLEPGAYTITRTATMESQVFRVDARLDGAIAIAFTQ